MEFIIFFDGYCHLCNHFLNWVVQHDTKSACVFAPLQGTTAAKYLNEDFRKNPQTVVVWFNGKIFVKTKAVSVVLKKLSLPYKIIGQVLSIIPTVLADYIYDVVANNRYRWWGRRDQCRIPTPQELKYLLP